MQLTFKVHASIPYTSPNHRNCHIVKSSRLWSTWNTQSEARRLFSDIQGTSPSVSATKTAEGSLPEQLEEVLQEFPFHLHEI